MYFCYIIIRNSVLEIFICVPNSQFKNNTDISFSVFEDDIFPYFMEQKKYITRRSESKYF